MKTCIVCSGKGGTWEVSGDPSNYVMHTFECPACDGVGFVVKQDALTKDREAEQRLLEATSGPSNKTSEALWAVIDRLEAKVEALESEIDQLWEGHCSLGGDYHGN